jgi:hypothetical protein
MAQEPDTHHAESADMRDVYRRLAERHAGELDELRESDGILPVDDSGRDRNRLRFSGSGVEGR